MAITQNATRVRVESAAKNGTLGSQVGIDPDQIKLDTNISTNNSNLEASPSLKWRHVILRRGETNEEFGIVQSVEGDGVTCNMYAAWESAPVSGDTYDVAYKLEDVATIAGCDFETDSRQWVMSKRLTIGDGTTFAFFGISHGQILRLQDSASAVTSAMRVTGSGIFNIGTIKNDLAERGAILIFANDADSELVMDWLSGARGRLYEFGIHSARSADGVTGLSITVDAAADVEWARVQTSGISSPFTAEVQRFKRWDDVFILTRADVVALPMWTGYMKSDLDRTLFQALSAEPSASRVRLLIEK